jgi:hypothetical protein
MREASYGFTRSLDLSQCPQSATRQASNNTHYDGACYGRKPMQRSVIRRLRFLRPWGGGLRGELAAPALFISYYCPSKPHNQ